MRTTPVTVIADRYQVGELIGRGGMAEVYAGVDTRLDRPVAIKLLSPEMAARPQIRSRFEAEARAAASLSHPHAVAVFDTGEDAGAPYIVMERLPGQTLADLIASGPVEPAAVRRVGAEVLGALGAAHAAGLVHRDVKPGNILIAADGGAKVADFGIAKSVEVDDGVGELTGTGQLFGTPAYLAPERLDGAPATAQSDLYALGVVLYEALAGTKPFDGMTPLATAQAVSTGAHRPLAEVRPGLQPRLVAAVERAMATDPARRFSSATEMAAALGGASGQSGDTLVLDRATVADPLAVPAPGDRRRLSVIGALVAALAGIVAIVLFAGVGSDGKPGASTQAGPAPATAPATAASSPTRQLAQALRDRATSLSAADGSLAAQVAARANQVADAVEAGNGGQSASGLLALLPVWNRSGLLADSATSGLVTLLKQVPGVDLTAYNAVATPAAPVPVPTTQDRGKGKGKSGD